MTKPLLTITALFFGIAAHGQITFTEVPGIPFEPLTSGSLAFADVDGDGDMDALTTGDGSTSEATILYTNDGTGVFTEVTGTPFQGVSHSSVAFADIDGDNDQDLLITGDTGTVNNGTLFSKLYTNNGSGQFTEVVGTPFEPAFYSSVAFADVDGDNDLDLFLSGRDSLNFGSIATLYTNDGLGNFTEVMGTNLVECDFGAIAFADVDGDNDPDLLITGEGYTEHVAKLYTNNGSGVFTEAMGTPFTGVSNSFVGFADMDGDNDLDVLISGSDANGTGLTKLYTNDGTGVFTEVTGTPFASVQPGEDGIGIADVDGDGDLDVLVTGAFGFFMYTTKLYTNDGTGVFTEASGTSFEPLAGAIAFADIDGDSDQDFLFLGYNQIFTPTVKLFSNGTAPAGMIDNTCDGANFIDSLFGDSINVPVVSSLYNNTGYSSAGDPTDGYDCFEESTGSMLDNTIWYAFEGDGSTYRIRSIQCNATDYIDSGNTQVAIYEGDCSNLVPVACNEDEDFFNDVRNFEVELQTSPGIEYRMLVDGFNDSITVADGEFCLEITRVYPTGIEGAAEVPTIEIYPNPTNGQINWTGINTRTAQLFDNTGRMVFSAQKSSGSLDMSNLPAGFYMLRLQTETGVFTSKIMKQ